MHVASTARTIVGRRRAFRVRPDRPGWPRADGRRHRRRGPADPPAARDRARADARTAQGRPRTRRADRGPVGLGGRRSTGGSATASPRSARDVEIPRAHTAFARPGRLAGRRRGSSTADEALELFPPVYDRVAAGRRACSLAYRGVVGERVARRLRVAPRRRRRARVRRARAGRAAGGVRALQAELLLRGRRPHRARPRSSRRWARRRRPTAAVWRYLLDIDWMAKIEAELLPVDHPLLLLLLEPNRMKFRVGDGLWMRPVDVGAALAARGVRGRRRPRPRGERRVLPVERRPLRAGGLEDDGRSGSAPLGRRARLRLPGRVHLRRPRPRGPDRGARTAPSPAQMRTASIESPWSKEPVPKRSPSRRAALDGAMPCPRLRP